ncbi:MAG: hypothetical protein JWN43_1915 [Gammaproteobacteria bacterium]|nr:hypothetical protein [Gammaproteobacteria bacterium]
MAAADQLEWICEPQTGDTGVPSVTFSYICQCVRAPQSRASPEIVTDGQASDRARCRILRNRLSLVLLKPGEGRI